MQSTKVNRSIRVDVAFKRLLLFVSLGLIVLLLCFLWSLIALSFPAIKRFGLSFLWSMDWDPVREQFGALPFLVGTLSTSFLALLISLPFAFAVAVFLGVYYPQGTASVLLRYTIELIAAVPSVIYGFWGLAVLLPMVRSMQSILHISPAGYGIFSASLVLAIMIIPYAASLGASMMLMVPAHLKEAAFALGATKWEMIQYVVIPYTRSGLFAGVLLSLGRALGETMAVTMLIGNTALLPQSIFDTSTTMASVIANELGEANKTVYTAALIELGLVLFVVTIVINILGKKIIKMVL